MANIENLTIGQVLYTVTRRKMGNTTIKENAVHAVVVKEIDLQKRRVLASWNSNTPRWFYGADVTKWKIKKPEAKK